MKMLVKSANFGISMLLILAAIAIAYIAIPAFGNKALIVRSGSMQPTIKVGDLVVVQTQKGLLSPLPTEALREGGNKYKEGDIIAFKNQNDSKFLMTHRIIGKVVKDGQVFYQTKGDANNTADQNLVAEENVIGKSTFQLPYFGRLFAFAKSNIGFPLLVIFPALLVIISEMINIVKEVKKTRAECHPELVSGSNQILNQVQNDKKGWDLNSKTSDTFEVDLDSSKVSTDFHLPPEIVTISTGRQNPFLPRLVQLSSPFGLKIIIPLAVGILIFQNSFAYFTDTAISAGNTFVASNNFPSPTPSPSPSPTPSPTPGPGDVVINEIMWMGGFNDDDEWMELKNRSDGPINVKGWNVTRWDQGDSQEKTLVQIPSNQDFIIPSGGYFLVTRRTSQAATSNLNIDPDVVHASMVFSNTNLQIKLYDGDWQSSANLIDTAGDKGAPQAGINGLDGNSDKSMERNSSPQDGTQTSSWHTATSSLNFDPGNIDLGTPRATNSVP